MLPFVCFIKSEISLFISFLLSYHLACESFTGCMKKVGRNFLLLLELWLLTPAAGHLHALFPPPLWYGSSVVMLFLFVLLTLRELCPLALFVLIECGWLLDSLPHVNEITIFLSQLHVEVVKTGWAVGRVLEMWTPGLCPTCCDTRDASGSSAQGWVVCTAPWGRTSGLNYCPHSGYCSNVFPLVRSAPLFTPPWCPFLPQPLLPLFSQWREWIQILPCLASLSFVGIRENRRTWQILHGSFQGSRYSVRSQASWGFLAPPRNLVSFPG